MLCPLLFFDVFLLKIYFKYYAITPATFNLGPLGSALSFTTVYLVVGQAANILGIFLATPISNRIGKKWTYFLAMLGAAMLSIAFYFIKPSDITTMLILQLLISICAGSIFPLLWSMYADIADYSEWRTGRRATGLIFSSSSMAQKLGWSLGGALTGWILSYVGFQANADQSSPTLEGIRLMLSALPAIGAFLSVLFIAWYPLSENKLNTITETLKAARKK